MIAANVPLTIASSVYAKNGSQPAAYTVVVFLFVYDAAFNLACNPLLYCYATEILPYRIRARGLGLQIAVSRAALTVNQYVNPIALDSIGYYYYIFYLGMLTLGVSHNIYLAVLYVLTCISDYRYIFLLPRDEGVLA
jgi:hypothetical protein